jgi:uncharacterized glyoxalase superfamily metalloenzyme YdcJ
MKHCLGEVDAVRFEARAIAVLSRLVEQADHDFMKLHFKHVPLEEIAAFGKGSVSQADLTAIAAGLSATFAKPEFALSTMTHAGFKDFTEGPSADTPVLLRQDSYRAIAEPVEFTEADGSVVKTTHTARFGEIEERFYACTPKGRALYDACLTAADAVREKDSSWPKRDMAGYEAAYAAPFKAFPKTLPELLDGGLVYARYAPTAKGIAAGRAGAIASTDLRELVRAGFADYEGLRYEDFLPVSAAGIFASNLQQYGAKSTAAVKPTYSQRMLEEILGTPIIDSTTMYAAFEAASKLETYAKLGILEKLPASERAAIESIARAK